MIIYNSLTFRKEEFKPINPNEVLIYVCGPTVYDSPHLGHAKSAVVFDIIRRYLEYKGYNVKLVKNYTDIDDKIINRANEKGISYKELSEYYIKEYEDIMKLLNIKKDYKNPRATEVIDFMIEIIKGLIDKGYAYESNGSVYFDVSKFPNYNNIFINVSEKEGYIEEISENEIDNGDLELEEKRNRKDFALWKKSKPNEPYWESPWGKGRPGWHIECTAMSIKYLGETLDIHGGGQDLKFPHHRNEIAQSEAYTGKKFANYFVHNGFVNVNNEKMSKSLGNFFLVSEVAQKYDPMILRLFLISSHYRKSINYSPETILQTQKNYNRFIKTIKFVQETSISENHINENENLIKHLNITKDRIIKAMDDDFNTPLVLSEITTFFKEINRKINDEKITLTENFKTLFFDFIKFLEDILGIFPDIDKKISDDLLKSKEMDNKLLQELLNIIIDIRSELRKRKIYDLSDSIREKLRALGFQIEDK